MSGKNGGTVWNNDDKTRLATEELVLLEINKPMKAKNERYIRDRINTMSILTQSEPCKDTSGEEVTMIRFSRMPTIKGIKTVNSIPKYFPKSIECLLTEFDNTSPRVPFSFSPVIAS